MHIIKHLSTEHHKLQISKSLKSLKVRRAYEEKKLCSRVTLLVVTLVLNKCLLSAQAMTEVQGPWTFIKCFDLQQYQLQKGHCRVVNSMDFRSVDSCYYYIQDTTHKTKKRGALKPGSPAALSTVTLVLKY